MAQPTIGLPWPLNVVKYGKLLFLALKIPSQKLRKTYDIAWFKYCGSWFLHCIVNRYSIDKYVRSFKWLKIGATKPCPWGRTRISIIIPE